MVQFPDTESELLGRFVVNIGGEGGAEVGAGGGRPIPQWGSEGITPEKFWKFYIPNVHFWEYLCANWSTEWVHFAVLNTDV